LNTFPQHNLYTGCGPHYSVYPQCTLCRRACAPNFPHLKCSRKHTQYRRTTRQTSYRTRLGSLCKLQTRCCYIYPRYTRRKTSGQQKTDVSPPSKGYNFPPSQHFQSNGLFHSQCRKWFPVLLRYTFPQSSLSTLCCPKARSFRSRKGCTRCWREDCTFQLRMRCIQRNPQPRSASLHCTLDKKAKNLRCIFPTDIACRKESRETTRHQLRRQYTKPQRPPSSIQHHSPDTDQWRLPIDVAPHCSRCTLQRPRQKISLPGTNRTYRHHSQLGSVLMNTNGKIAPPSCR